MEINRVSYLYLDLHRLQNILANLHPFIAKNASANKLKNLGPLNLLSLNKNFLNIFYHAYLKSTMGVVLGFNHARAISIVFSFLAIKKFSAFMVIN